jgi:hypothetical protein
MCGWHHALLVEHYRTSRLCDSVRCNRGWIW